MPVYVMLVDEHHHIVAANEAVRRDLGVSREAIIGAYCPRAIHGTDSPFPGCPLEECMAHSDKVCEKEVFDERTGRWVGTGVYPTTLRSTDGARVFLHTARDITENKRAAEALERSRELQRTTAEILSLSLEDLTVDQLTGRVLDLVLSIQWMPLKPRGSIALIERDGGEHVLVTRAHRGFMPAQVEGCARIPMGKCHCGIAAASGKVVHTGEIDDHHIRYEGMPPHGHYCVPIRRGSEVLGVLNTYIAPGHPYNQEEVDFLEAAASALAGVLVRKRIEEERNQIQTQLLHSQKMEAVGRLAGGVAHDFNNLLTVIISQCALAREDHGEDDPLDADLALVEDAAKRAATLTRQLLTFSRKGIERPELLDLTEVIGGLEKMLRRVIGEDIELHVSLPASLGPVSMDASNMEQIVMNLVVNARDAMPRGGRLSISGTRATLDADEPQLGLPAGNYVEIVVSDTGVGMAEDVKEKVFEPFFTTKDVGKGTGLGLATVHGIVNAVGGEITVESEPGRGTTFIIYLPISQRGTRRDAVPSVQLPRPRDLTVLLVDDEPTVRRAVRRLMERAGHRVLESRSPSDAIAIAATHAAEIDVLLTDVVMPEMSGFQLASELREVHPSLRVVLMSGHSDDLIAHHAELDRGVSMLRKPFSPEELNRKLFEVLE